MMCARRPAGARKPALSAESPRRPDPRRGLRRALAPFRCLPALALLLGVLSPFAAAPAAAAVLVSNVGQTQSAQFYVLASAGARNAQGFTTGGHAAGYTLASIELSLRNGSANPLSAAQRALLKVELWSSTSAGLPDSKVADLTTPSNVPVGINNVAFAAPTNTTLAANTTYHVVVHGDATSTLVAQLTAEGGGGEDTGGAAGWSIADKYSTRGSTGWTLATLTGAYRIRVNGEAAQVVAPTVPRDVTVTPGDGKLTLNWKAPTSWGSWTAWGYEVHWKLSSAGDGGWGEVRKANSAYVPSTTETSFVFTGLQREYVLNQQTTVTNGTAYDLRIKATSQQPGSDGSEVSHYQGGAWVTISNVVPAAPPAGTATLSVSPTFLVAGQSATATVTLSAAQPGWVQVEVDSSGGTAHEARVLDPPSVYLIAGATSGTSTVRTNAAVPQALGTKNIVIGTIAKQPNVGTIVAGSPSSVEIEIVEPREVRNLDATAASGRLDLSWDAPLEVTATGYHVHYTSAAAGDVANDAAVQTGTAAAGWVAVSRTGTTTSQAISSLTDGTTYRVRVRAVYVSDGSIRSAWSHTSGTPADTTPKLTLSASPTTVVRGDSYTLTGTLSAAQPGWVSLALRYADGTTHSSRYSRVGSIFISAGSTSGTATGRTNATGVRPIGTFTARIDSITEQGDAGAVQQGTPSSVDITIVDPRPARNLGASATDGGLNVSWDAPSEVTAAGYDVHYTSSATAGNNAAVQTGASPSPADGWVAVDRGTEASPPQTSQAISGLDNGTTYRVRVRAAYSAVQSAWTFASGTPGDAPAPLVCVQPQPSEPAPHSPRPGYLSLALTAGGSPVTVKKRTDSEVHWHATVPYGTSQVTVTPTWSYAAHITGTVQSSGYPSYANGNTWPQLTAETAVTSGGSVTVDLASGNPDVHAPTSVVVVLTRSPCFSTGYHLEVTQGGEIEADLSISPATVMEGGKATVTVTLSQPVPAARDVRIPLTMPEGQNEDWRIEVGENAFWDVPDPYILVRMRQRTGTMDLRMLPGSAGKTLTVALDTANLPSGTSFGAGANGLQGATPWSVVAGATASVARTITADMPGTEPPTVVLTPELYALIEKVREWRNDPRYSSNKAHTDRWDRVLLAFGLPVPDRSLRAMSAAEAQGYADRGWTRWVAVAEALRAVEGPPPPAPDPVVTVAGDGPVTEGAAAGFTLTASRAPSADLAVAVSLSQYGAFAQPSALGARTVTIPAGGTSAAFTVATVDDAADEADGAIAATLAGGAGYTLGDAARATVKVADNDEDNPGLVTKRAIAREGTDEAAVFTVRLDRAASHAVTVDYATADGSGAWAGTAPARAGADYTATSGTLTFAAGETSKTVSVPILDDAIDEGMEYFLLRFRNPQGATLAAGHRETQGLIRNDDHLQTMWLSRFGRTVGSQVTDAVSERLTGGLSPGAHATLAGQSVDLSKTEDGQALADVLTGFARAFGAPGAPASDDDPFARLGLGGAWNEPAASAPARSMTGRELLLGSAFHLATEGEGSGPGLAAWGRVAQGSFDGEHADDTGSTRVDGEVLTGVLGADAEWSRLLAGVAISLSEGEGKYDSPGVDRGKAGRIESTMTTVSPYARFEVTEGVSAWGLAGWGTGDMTIRFDDGSMAPVRTDLSMQLGAIGARGALLVQDASGGMDLALKADAFFVTTESEKAANSAATTADASRLRLVLEGARAFAVGEGATLRPLLELGLRYDGGDAETGAGVEIGGGVSYADPASGLSVDARARMLVAHADSDYEEWGASATARLDPGADGRGLSLSLAPTIGAASSASERLWGARDARGLAPGGEFEAARGVQAEAGYGLALPGGRFTGMPNVGFGMSETAREYRMGWRLTAAASNVGGFEVSLDAIRREPANDGAEHGVMLRGLLRW